MIFVENIVRINKLYYLIFIYTVYDICIEKF